VLPPGDEGAEGVVPQSLAVLGAQGAAQFEGGQSFASGVEFPGRLGYGAGAEAVGIAQAGDPAVQYWQRPLGGRCDCLCDIGGHGRLLDADLEQCGVVQREPPEPEGAGGD
jgi:hypothetical protein